MIGTSGAPLSESKGDYMVGFFVSDGLLNRPIRYRPRAPGPEPLYEDKDMKLT